VTVSGFVHNTTIDLTGVPYDSAGTATLLGGDELRVIESTMTLDIKVSEPNYTSATTFTLASDGSGGSEITTDAASNEVIYVSAGATSTGLEISNGETLYVLSGGTAVSTTVTTGGYELVSGGKTVGTVVSSGGQEVVFSGGVTTSVAVSAGGIEYVLSGGTAFDTTVSSGGSASDIPAGVFVSTVVSDGGTEYVNGTARGTIVSSGGLEDVTAGGTADTIVLSAGGAALLEESSVASGAIIFAGSGADLRVGGNSLGDGPIVASVTVSGFVHNTTIDLTGVPYDSAGTATLLGGDELRVIESTMTLDIQVSDPNYTSATTFTLASDGSGGSKITTDAACYRAGTRIRTDRGEVPVEALGIGDRVLSAFGGVVPVTWLGQRRVDCRRHPQPRDVWPVRVAAGALGPNQPVRDLWLSPDHAVYVDGVLVPIRYLVNDATIVQEPTDQVTYWHVELPQHDVLFAEGLPAESYLDTGNRGAFANGGGALMLHPDFALRVWEAAACARLVRDGADLVAIRSVLLDRARALGHAVTRDAGLHLVVDGRIVQPIVQGRVHRFRLIQGVGAVRLVSRCAIPAWVRAESDDHRRLGVAVSHLVLDGRGIPLADARLGAGWHPLEPDGTGGGWRWTDGDAALDVAGARVLELEVAMTERYWLARASAATRVA
jgi:autotransporter passenger strand-loop-strand repeat protein